jgi:MFS family permease
LRPIVPGAAKDNALMTRVAGFRSPWVGLAVVCLGSLVAPLDTAVPVAFPVITAAFGLPLREAQWVVIPFVIGQLSMALIFGYLGDRLGHRRVFAMGLGASLLAHAAIAFVTDFVMLAVLRLVQGMAVGMAVACAPALATLLFPASEKARVLAWYAAATSLAMALGPWIGGWMIHAFGWPAVFWFRAPVSLVALLMLPLLGRPGPLPARAESTSRFDWPGATGLTVAMACVGLALSALTHPEGIGAWGVLILALAIVSSALFVRHESRAAHPVLRMTPFRSLRFSGIQAASVTIQMTGFANLMLVPFVMLREAGAAVASVGVVVSAYPAGGVLGSLLVGRFARGVRAETLIACGLAGSATGLMFTATLLYLNPASTLVAMSLLASGLALGVFQPGYMDATTSMLPLSERGVAGSLVTVSRLLGIMIAVTCIGWLQARTGHFGLSFALLGGGLAMFAAAFAAGVLRGRRGGE